VPLRHQLAEILRSLGDFVAEAAVYHDITQIASEDVTALRGRAFAALRMGAPDIAASFAEANPQAFSAQEILQLQQARAGRQVKWAEIEARHGIGLDRLLAADKALTMNGAVRSAISQAGNLDSPAAIAIEFDRVVALRNRVLMPQAIELFEAIQQRKLLIPAYVLAAAADACLHQKKPKRARDLYLRALQQSAGDSGFTDREWQFGLVQAYFDTFQFDEARLLLDRLQAEIPPVLHKGLRRAEIDNPYYEQVRTDSARLRLHADRLNESAVIVSEILEKAPFSIDARLVLGELQQARDQPRSARAQFTSVLVDDPTNLYAAIGIADSALTTSDLYTARNHLDVLLGSYPENPLVQRAQKKFKHYSRPRLTMSSGTGNSTGGGGNRGEKDRQLSAILNFGSFHDNYSLFLRTFSNQADFGDNTSNRRRSGFGSQFVNHRWRLTAELDFDQTEFSDVGAKLLVTWFKDDHWQFDVGFESNSNKIPLQAHASGIDAEALNLGLRYSHNESRRLESSFTQLWLSDGNRRVEIGFDWFERWISGPIYKLDTLFSVSRSTNSRRDAPYFNPRRGTSFDLLNVNEWNLWRRDLRSFKHRVILGIGEYWQQGIGTESTHTLRYEHSWDLDGFRSLNYGVEHTRHPYDGVLSERTGFYFNFEWHF
jgi:biofilm PGA synthesis protein PgaA